MRCQAKDCENEATHTVYWPGQITIQCAEHASRCMRVGAVMGFNVAIVKREEK